MRPSVVVLIVVDAALLIAASVSAASIDPFVSRVEARPWPARVTPTGPWTATLEGSGSRFTMTAVTGAIPGALDDATFRLPGERRDPLNLTLPEGTIWHPEGEFRLQGAGPLAFTSVRARDSSVDLSVGSLEAVLGAAEGPVTAVGTFTGPAGERVDRLSLPATARIGEDCGRPKCSDPFPPADPVVTLPVGAGAVVRASHPAPGAARAQAAAAGEVVVAGTARAAALGRTWDGLVGAVEGTGLEATATWDGRAWSVSANAGAASQIWIDVWPVADTTVTASSKLDVGPHSCFRDCSVRLRWANTGWATGQILEAEGVGSGSTSVRFGLTGSRGHDAGLGVSRGSRKNLGGGSAIASSLQPRQADDRGLTTKPGSAVTLVLRGNFPEVQVPLAVRPA